MTKGKAPPPEFFVVWSGNSSQPFKAADGKYLYIIRVEKHFPSRELTVDDYAYFVIDHSEARLTLALTLSGAMMVIRHRMFPGDFADDPRNWSQKEYDDKTNHGAY